MGNLVAFNHIREELGMNKSKAKGTMVETALVNYLKEAGFPDARRKPLTGALDQGDVDLTVHPTIIAECKYASRGVKLTQWMRELKVETINADAAFGLLVAKQFGAGDQSVGRWVAACTISHYALISKVAPVLPRPADLWPSCAGTAIPGAKINGRTGWVEQLINQGNNELNPERWHLNEFGNEIGWRCITQQSSWSDEGTVESFIVGPLWRFLVALRRSGYGEPLN